MYKEANTIYLHNNLSQWEQDEIIRDQSLLLSTYIQYLFLGAFGAR